MCIDTSEICDYYAEEVDVLDPIFASFGGKQSFCGKVTTVKCLENNGILYEILKEDGTGRVLVVDGGGIVRNALIDAELAELALDNNWEGIVVNGAVRQVQFLEQMDIGIQALASIPIGANDDVIGESDIPINFAGVSIFPEDFIYADTTGMLLSQEELDITLSNEMHANTQEN